MAVGGAFCAEEGAREGGGACWNGEGIFFLNWKIGNGAKGKGR